MGWLIMDYLNPNSLLDRGQGIYGEVGFGESVDSGILRQLQAENQMRQANSSGLMDLALKGSELPNKIAASNLQGLRDKLMSSPEFIKLYGEQFQGQADKAYSEGALARAGLPQKIANQEQTLGIQNRQNAAILQDIDNLVKQGAIPPQLAQAAKAKLTGNAPNLRNPLSTFGAFQGASGYDEMSGNSLSARIAKLMAQADEKTQSTLMGKKMDYNKGLVDQAITSAGQLQGHDVAAAAQKQGLEKTILVQQVQQAKNDAHEADQRALMIKNEAKTLADSILSLKDKKNMTPEEKAEYQRLQDNLELARAQYKLYTKRAELSRKFVAEKLGMPVEESPVEAPSAATKFGITKK